MKKLILILLLALSKAGFCTTWTVTGTGVAFTPSTLTINKDDSVMFVIDNTHNIEEVSEATWNANGTTPLPGFSVPFGGGIVPAAQLPVGTHYYICTAHASSGMKGIIVVQNPAGIEENLLQTDICLYPNPSRGLFQFTLTDPQVLLNCRMEVCNISGETVYRSEIGNVLSCIDLTKQAKGIYFVKFYNDRAVLTRRIVVE